MNGTTTFGKRASATSLAALGLAILLALGGVAFAQGTVSTGDGLEMALSSSGSVSSLRVSGAEQASGTVPSGFFYRELPATAANSAPNGSFESGSTSWSFTNSSNGTWSVDSTTAAAGTKSLKLYIPGTTNKRSPMLTSGTITLLPNTSYTFSCQFKTSAQVGSMALYFLEKGSDGKSVQRGFTSAVGTTLWTKKTLTFTTSPLAISGSFKAEVYSGHGTSWLDDVQLVDVFSGKKPVAFGGSVSSSGGVLTHSASASGLSLSAKFTSIGSAIKVDTTLTSTTGTDRPVELSFRLPLNIPGWIWDNDFVTPTPIVAGTRYENLNTGFGPQNHSIYPFATVRNSSSALSLAVPLVPQMNRFSYDTKYGLRCTWDLGLSPAATKTPNKATLTFWIYSSTPKWGMRAAAEKYYALNPASFTSNAPVDKGAWVLLGTGNTLTSIPNSQDFGWGYNDGYGNIDFANAKGLLALHYVDPSGWFHRFPTYEGGPQPPYSVLSGTLNTEATSGTGGTTDSIPVKEMAQAVINSSPYNVAGLYQFSAKPYFWYKNTFQIYPVFADPDIPAPSMHSVIKKYSVDKRIDMATGSGNHLDGIFLDDVALVSNLENHRRALWAYSSSPPSFSYATRKVTLWGGFSTAEFLQSLRSYLHSKSLTLGGSIGGGNLWFTPHLDIVGGEVRGFEALDRAYGRRTLGYGKLWSNLLVPEDDLPASAATVLAYMRQALSLGYFPGFNGDYWKSSTAYERDRPTFKKYIPLIKKVAAAGWKPVPYATSSNPAVFIERFDNQTGNVFYLTAHNSGTATTTASLTLDGAALGITSSSSVAAKELLSNASVPAARAGANVTLSDSLAPGETTLYEFTVTGGSPTPSPTPAPTPTAGSLIPNGSFETGTPPTGWTLGTSALSGTWSWDTVDTAAGTRAAKLTVPGTTKKKSPNLVSNRFVLSGSRTYNFAAWTKSVGVGGNYRPFVYVVELDSSGALLKTTSGDSIQHGLAGDLGSTGWSRKTLTFTTDPRCRKAYVYANIYDGYGTFRVDYIQLYAD
jgi:hypothetical protein